MKKVALFNFLILSGMILFAQTGNITIGRIISEIDSFKDKTITVNMRLKYVDHIFDKIIFYDSENVDVEFDISGKEKKKELSDNLINIHEGMLYHVTFRVIGTGSLGGLTGSLNEFIPVIVDKIPEKSD